MVNKTKKHKQTMKHKHTMKRNRNKNSKYFKDTTHTSKHNGKSFKSKKNVFKGGGNVARGSQKVYAPEAQKVYGPDVGHHVSKVHVLEPQTSSTGKILTQESSNSDVPTTSLVNLETTVNSGPGKKTILQLQSNTPSQITKLGISHALSLSDYERANIYSNNPKTKSVSAYNPNNKSVIAYNPNNKSVRAYKHVLDNGRPYAERINPYKEGSTQYRIHETAVKSIFNALHSGNKPLNDDLITVSAGFIDSSNSKYNVTKKLFAKNYPDSIFTQHAVEKMTDNHRYIKSFGNPNIANKYGALTYGVTNETIGKKIEFKIITPFEKFLNKHLKDADPKSHADLTDYLQRILIKKHNASNDSKFYPPIIFSNSKKAYGVYNKLKVEEDSVINAYRDLISGNKRNPNNNINIKDPQRDLIELMKFDLKTEVNPEKLEKLKTLIEKLDIYKQAIDREINLKAQSNIIKANAVQGEIKKLVEARKESNQRISNAEKRNAAPLPAQFKVTKANGKTVVYDFGRAGPAKISYTPAAIYDMGAALEKKSDNPTATYDLGTANGALAPVSANIINPINPYAVPLPAKQGPDPDYASSTSSKASNVSSLSEKDKLAGYIDPALLGTAKEESQYVDLFSLGLQNQNN
jgi:hypothetical protein